MKTAFLALIGLATVHALAGTAYDALGTLGKQRGDKVVDQVTEVRGMNGAPQPREWLIVVADKEARSGVREFGIQGTKIGAERAPAGREPGAVMNMNLLNLDSDGAQTIADREAKKAGFDYDYADYTLRAGTRGGTPIWELRLVDEKSGRSGIVTIAADKGTLLSAEGFNGKSRARQEPPPPAEDAAPDRGQPVAKTKDGRPPTSGRAPSPGLQKVGDKMSSFFDRVGRHLDRRGRQIGDTFHNLVTGDDRDSAGPHAPRVKPEERKESAPPPPPPPSRTYRDAGGTEYARPRD